MAQETEAKFYVQHPEALQERVESLGAHPEHMYVREVNLRFDTSARALSKAGHVLRLRQDQRARLTYKGSERSAPGTLSRREVEVTVSDFDETRELLEALGYEVIFIYEKYRSTYKLGALEIVLDELPYGHFIEIEGQEDQIQPTAQRLGLNWGAVIRDSYHQLFERVRLKQQWAFRDLTFEDLKNVQVSAADLGVSPADT
jgi:adenylate cyclase class 2